MAAVLKTADGFCRPWVQIPLSPPSSSNQHLVYFAMDNLVLSGPPFFFLQELSASRCNPEHQKARMTTHRADHQAAGGVGQPHRSPGPAGHSAPVPWETTPRKKGNRHNQVRTGRNRRPRKVRKSLWSSGTAPHAAAAHTHRRLRSIPVHSN